MTVTLQSAARADSFFRPARFKPQPEVRANGCTSEKEGVRCGLPKGHWGLHQNSAHSYRVRPWSDGDVRTQ